MPYRRIQDVHRLQALLGAVLLIESDLELQVLLRHIVEAACELVGARYGALGVLSPRERRIAQFVTVGMAEDVAAAIGHYPDGLGILGLLIDSPEPLRLSKISEHPAAVGFPPGHPPMNSFIGVPVRIRDEVFGNLYLTEKMGTDEFDDDDLDVVETLAVAAGIGISNARLHAQLSELSVLADRDRMARDLHDTVIQRLYGIGLSLQGSVRRIEDPALKERLQDSLDEIDDTIIQVRTTIFELEERSPRNQGLRAQVLALTGEAARVLGFEPSVRVAGPLDSAIGPDLASNVLAVLREALSNVARHSGAGRVDIEVRVEQDELEVVVADDGVGYPQSDAGRGSGDGSERGEREPAVGNGVTNMGQRAQSLGGSCMIGARAGGGTEVYWRVPV